MVTRENNARRTGPALEAMYQFLQWLVPTVDKFPRARKFTLGERIETTALDVSPKYRWSPSAYGCYWPDAQVRGHNGVQRAIGR